MELLPNVNAFEISGAPLTSIYLNSNSKGTNRKPLAGLEGKNGSPKFYVDSGLNPINHFERKHFSDFRHGLRAEMTAGLVAPDWSTTSEAANMPKPKGKGVVAGYAGHVPHERDFIGGSYRNVRYETVKRGEGTIHSTVDLDGDGQADNFEGYTAGVLHHGMSAYVSENANDFNDAEGIIDTVARDQQGKTATLQTRSTGGWGF